MGRRARRGRSSPGWAVAKGVLRRALRERGLDPDQGEGIGRLRLLGEGLSYRVYDAPCPWHGGGTIDLVVRVPKEGDRPQQSQEARREAELLGRLRELELPWRLPEPIALVALEEGLSPVQGLVPGMPLRMNAGGSWGLPWEVIADVAATCHAIDPEPFQELLPGSRTRRECAEKQLEVLQRSDLPEFREAWAWSREHLPPATPARLLHGDLLGQNLHLDLDGGPVGVLDWSEARIGDPAAELSIVTRGARRPFKSARGLSLLVAAYNERANEALSEAEVHLHELCMLARHYLWSEEADGAREAHLQTLRSALRNLLGRARAAAEG